MDTREGGGGEAAGKKHLRPIPVETSFRSSKLNDRPTSAPPGPTPSSLPQNSPPADAPAPRRRFEPDLIETLKRSKRNGDGRPATLPTDKVIACSVSRAPHANCSIHSRLTLRPVSRTYTHHVPSGKVLARRPTPRAASTPTRSSHLHHDGSSLCDHILIQEGVPVRTRSNLNWTLSLPTKTHQLETLHPPYRARLNHQKIP